MTIILLEEPAEFLARTAPLFTSDPFSTNVIAVVAERTIDGSLQPTDDDVWIVVTDDEGAVVGAGMANAPYNLFLSRMPERAAIEIAQRLADDERSLPGVTGEQTAARAFDERWQRLVGGTSVVQIAHCVYRLDTLEPPTGLVGSARRATRSEAPLVATWLDEFHDEALPHDPVVDSVELANQRIEADEFWCWWVGDEPVSMAACGAPTAGVARIGPVYTPAAQRSHGYAAGATAAATQGALDTGADHVMLYADRSNPISNALYQRLGFRPHHDAIDFGFRPAG